MKRAEFNTIEDFIGLVNETYIKSMEINKNSMVSIVAKYDEAKIIVRELFYKYDYHSCLLNFDECNRDEYLITLANTDGDILFCERFKNNVDYLEVNEGIAFVLDNCCSKCLDGIHSKIIIEVGIDDEDDDSGEDTALGNSSSEYFYISRDNDGKPTGFQKSWSTSDNDVYSYSSYSFYSSDDDMLRKMADVYDIVL